MRFSLLFMAGVCLAQTPAPQTPGMALGSPKKLKLKALTPAESQPAPGALGQRDVGGVHRAITTDQLKKGGWKKLKDGREVWRLAIHSPKAVAMRVHFQNFNASTGQVWVRSSTAKPEVFGPYSGKGPGDAGDFWSDVVSADTIVVEYLSPSGRTLPFVVPHISHILKR